LKVVCRGGNQFKRPVQASFRQPSFAPFALIGLEIKRKPWRRLRWVAVEAILFGFFLSIEARASRSEQVALWFHTRCTVCKANRALRVPAETGVPVAAGVFPPQRIKACGNRALEYESTFSTTSLGPNDWLIYEFSKPAICPAVFRACRSGGASPGNDSR